MHGQEQRICMPDSAGKPRVGRGPGQDDVGFWISIETGIHIPFGPDMPLQHGIRHCRDTGHYLTVRQRANPTSLDPRCRPQGGIIEIIDWSLAFRTLPPNSCWILLGCCQYTARVPAVCFICLIPTWTVDKAQVPVPPLCLSFQS